MDAEIRAAFQVVLELQAGADKRIGQLIELQIQSHDRLEQAHRRTEAAIEELGRSIARYVDSADARMKRIEESLDSLIRAITREHSNGRAGQNQ